jgi:hypothetical protein
MKVYKHLLVSGCSFTSDGIGGSPPSLSSDGGCSFAYDTEFIPKHSKSWAGFLAQKLNVKSLVNTAAAGHGNILIANSILECLNRFGYNSTDTLVIVNISDPARFDAPCLYNHPGVDDKNIPWDHTLLPYSYLNRSNKIIKDIEKNIGIEQIEYLTTNYVEFLFTLLENRNIDFYFLTMNDFNNSYLTTVLNKFNRHFIKLNPGPSMIQFCQQTNSTVTVDDYHPNIIGHKQIANILYTHINQ